MKLGPTIALRQQARQGLSLQVQRGLAFMASTNEELANSLQEAAAENPWLGLHMPAPASGGMVEEAPGAGPTLHEHVLSCLPTLICDMSDEPIALAIVEELDDRGIVARPIEAIAKRCGVTLERAHEVLCTLQRIEPRGLFARTIAECLALQLDEEERCEIDMLRLLSVLPKLAEAGLDGVMRDSGLSEPQVLACLARLRKLDPRPAAGFARAAARPRVADLIFREDAAASWQVWLNPETTPKAWVLGQVRGMERDPDTWSRTRREARGLVAAVERRNATLLALGALLAREQAGFLARGEVAQRPLTLRRAAQEIGIHESTLNRIANACAADTPQGTVSLRRFFCRSVRCDGQDGPSAPAMMARIARMIASEPPGAPLSDSKIAERLTEEGMAVSRRVTAKLRARAGFANRAQRRSSARHRPAERVR